MNPIHDNQGNLIAIEMHNTRISAEALSQMAARVAALEAQIAECQQANTALIFRVVELEHERDAALRVVACAVSLVGRAEGLSNMLGGPDYEHVEAGNYIDLSCATAAYLTTTATPPLSAAPGRCDRCGLPLVSSHIVDETVITNGERRVSVHHACASAYPGWTPVATARGGA